MGLFCLEQLDDMGGLKKAVDDLQIVLNLEDQELADAFVTFINHAVLPRLVFKGDKIPVIRDLQEVPTMIGQRIERIKDNIANQARSEGLQEGLQEGRQKGLLEGREEGLLEGRRRERQTVLRELFEHRFGVVDQQVDIRLRQASLEKLLHWSRKALAAKTLEEVFSDHGSEPDGP